MPIVEEVVKKEIESFMKKPSSGTLTEDSSKQIEDFAGSLAKVIVQAIKSATVTVNPGITVLTSSPMGPLVGTTTSPGTGVLS